MLELLLLVIILGIVAWVISALPMPQMFKTIAFAILAIILVVFLFRLLSGSSLNIG